MASRFRQTVAPAYVLLCLLLGGSAQGIWSNLLLQLIGIAILSWAAVSPTEEPLTRPQRQLFGCIILGLVVVALQLIPLPPDWWQALGGREAIAEGFKVLGLAPPWLPVSVTPYNSAATLLTIIPPLAMLAAMVRLGYRPLWLVLALLAGTIAGILLGALQVSSADPAASPWYPYPQSNFGVATGFFANANHMATLLVIALPFLAALLASARAKGGNVQRYSAVFALVAGTVLVIAVGLALNGSLAGVGLAVPVLFASALIVLPRRSRAIRWMAPASGVLLVAAVAVIALNPLNSSAFRSSAGTSVVSRQEIAANSLRAAGEFMPLGSGLGSFRSVYLITEDHDRLDPTVYVNHAHNDFLELALETGVAGVIVLILFLAWWGAAAWRAWRGGDSGPYARAAAIASAAILVHSLVDFPLRTAAISACFAMCLGLLAERRKQDPADQSALWPTRHVVLG